MVPEALFEANFPAEILFRLQTKIVSKNLVLAARRTKARRNARMHDSLRRRNPVTAGKTIRPDPAELVEMVVTPAGDQIQSRQRVRVRFQIDRTLIGVIADKGRLRSEI